MSEGTDRGIEPGDQFLPRGSPSISASNRCSMVWYVMPTTWQMTEGSRRTTVRNVLTADVFCFLLVFNFPHSHFRTESSKPVMPSMSSLFSSRLVCWKTEKRT